VPSLSKILITAALPYANAKLHLGHLRSTYIPSDIYARYLRLKGENVLYICASDEHGTPVAVRAEKEGVTPQEYVDRYHKLIKEDLEKVGCSFDIFSRTTHPVHAKLTQEFFLRLLENGYIYDAEYEQLFCPNCKRFLPDRYVEGICPYCGAEGARGDACEACGRYLKPTELRDPYCVICHSKPNIEKTRHWFFKLSALQKFLEDWITKNEKLPANVKHYASQWLREGLKDWCITRDLQWGVRVPVKGGEDKVIYVWFDAPIGYVSATKVLSETIGKPAAWKEYWQKDGKFIHFIGKDIIYHHAIFWPAMLKCYGDYNLPTTLVASEFLTLEGKKMSKSRGWVVEISDYLKTFEPDSLRYYLTVVSPLHKDADFSWDDFGHRHNDELADILGNFIHRALTFTYRNFNKKIPKPRKFDDYDLNVLNAIKETHKRVAEQIEIYNFHVAVKSAIELAALGNRYLNEKQPWATVKTAPEKAGTALYVSNQIVKALTIMLEPFIPFTAETLWHLLNLPGSVHEQNWDETIKELPPGHKLNPPKPIFKKIEPTTIESQKKMLQESLEEAAKPMITIEGFSRLSIKAGTIVGVEPVPGSNKLLKLKIDLGEGDIQQAVTGIAPWYKPDELQGKQIAVLTNIKPAKMFGVESQVMILAAEDEKTVSILRPDKPVKPGSKVH